MAAQRRMSHFSHLNKYLQPSFHAFTTPSFSHAAHLCRTPVVSTSGKRPAISSSFLIVGNLSQFLIQYATTFSNLSSEMVTNRSTHSANLFARTEPTPNTSASNCTPAIFPPTENPPTGLHPQPHRPPANNASPHSGHELLTTPSLASIAGNKLTHVICEIRLVKQRFRT